MYNEIEEKTFTAFELFVMACDHGLRKEKVNVDMQAPGLPAVDPWNMTIEEACRGAINASCGGRLERAGRFLAPVIRRLRPASLTLVEDIKKLSRKK